MSKTSFSTSLAYFLVLNSGILWRNGINILIHSSGMSLGLILILYWFVNKGDISGLLTAKAFLFVSALSFVEHEVKKWKK